MQDFDKTDWFLLGFETLDGESQEAGSVCKTRRIGIPSVPELHQ